MNMINGYDLDNVAEILSDLQHLRNVRKDTVFKIINRGKLWYDNLTPAQLAELGTWYQGWLDAPETMIIPDFPEWLKE